MPCTINTVAEAYDAYDDTTGDIIRHSLRNSLILRPSIGWRPFEHAGFEVMAGYTRMILGGGVSAREVVEAISGENLDNIDADVNIPLRTTMNAFHASLGWRWRLTDHLVLRASVGYLQAFSSNTSVRINVPPQLRDELATLNRALDAYVDDITKSYIKTPTASLFLAFRF